MTRILRNVLVGAVTLMVLSCVSPTTIQAAHYQGYGDRVERHAYVYRPYYYEPFYRYYAPDDGCFYYRGVRRYYGPYYGVPGYGYYRGPWGGGAVHAGPVHVWW